MIIFLKSVLIVAKKLGLKERTKIIFCYVFGVRTNNKQNNEVFKKMDKINKKFDSVEEALYYVNGTLMNTNKAFDILCRRLDTLNDELSKIQK